MNKKTITAIVAVAVLLVIIGVAYAALSATLNINGTTTVMKQTWKVEFTQVTATEASSTGKGAQAVTLNDISTGAPTITWSTTLNQPGDYAQFVAEISNTGTIDAVIAGSSFDLGEFGATTSNVVSYEVCYVKDITGAQLVDADGANSTDCVKPKLNDVFYGTTAVAADSNKIGKRYIKVRLYYDPSVIDEDGSNLTAISDDRTGLKDNKDNSEPPKVISKEFKINTVIPFAQYTGA